MYLNARSYYSFNYGTLSVQKLLEQTSAQGVKRLALTDINSTAGILEFFREAPRFGIEPVAGVEFRNGHECVHIALAHSILGFEEINRYLSEHLQARRPFPARAPVFKQASVIYPYRPGQLWPLKPHEYIGVRPSDLLRFRLDGSVRIYAKQLVALLSVNYGSALDVNLHKLLRAVDLNLLYSKLPAEALCAPDQFFQPEAEWKKRFGSSDFLLRNAEELLEKCRLDFEFGVPKNRKRFGASDSDDYQLLETLAYKGARERYGQLTPQLCKRLEKELDIISKKGFMAYFLINWDIVNFAQSRGYFYVGRGSGANSMVAYCLRITDVDPVDLDLYFERFINLYRENPPDFDLDFSWKDRDEIQSYIFRRYGTEHTCLLATCSTYKMKGALRELGKVAGLPLSETEELIAGYGKVKPKDKISAAVARYAGLMLEFPSHLSIHAGGVLISHEPIYRYTAPILPPKGFPVSQFDMYVSEDLGLYKFDILSQRGLGHIKDAVESVRVNRGIDIDIRAVEQFKQDEKIRELLRRGDCMGCFYVESPAMRGLLAKLRCDTYLDLVAASSIIRPGVASSGMMREFIMRHRDPQARVNIHPVMGKIMPDTYGVMVYQEDVIKVAHHFAGLSLAEADVLRRGMSGKFRSREEFQRVKDQFFINCKSKGYADELAQEIWRQIESFAGYSFAKGHSASYAVESYQSLYLKAHFPMEFMVAVINNFGGFYRTGFYFQELQRAGAELHLPCVNESEYLTRICGNTVWMGFVHIARLEQKMAWRIIEERTSNGAYENLADFVQRSRISLEQLLLLVRAGAFAFTGLPKSKLLWEAHFLCNGKTNKNNGAELFRPPAPKTFELPALQSDALFDLHDQLELLGFPVVDPFSCLEKLPPNRVMAADLPRFMNQQVCLAGLLVTTKPTRTVKGEYMCFGTFTDECGNWLDTVHFPQVAAAYPFRGEGIYQIIGRVTEDFGALILEVDALFKLPYRKFADEKYEQKVPEAEINRPLQAEVPAKRV